MNGRFLLDTNIVIELFGRGKEVRESIAQAGEVFLCSIVLGELFFGARNSGRIEENIKRIEEFAAVNFILSCDDETAAIYGQVKSKLKLRGRPIPENDVWIAALCLQHSLTLASRDTHFEEVEDLLLESW